MSGEMPDAKDEDRRDIPASVEEPACFRPVFERHVDQVHRYVARRLGPSPAEDVVGETFAIAFRQRSTYDPSRASGRAWLLGIATNLIRRHQRDELRRLAAYSRITASEPQGSTDEIAERVSETARLDAALSSLSPDLRDVILLIGGAALSYAEASAALSIPIGTVRSRMWRARRELRAQLAESDSWSERQGTGLLSDQGVASAHRARKAYR